jgi:hypothetical protein
MFIAVCVCLIVQGLAASRDDVINLVAAASHDGSGHLHFDEFLDLMSARRLPGMDPKLAAALEDKWVFRGGGGWQLSSRHRVRRAAAVPACCCGLSL